MKACFMSIVGALVSGAAFAALRPGVPFADGMVLQRGMKLPVWGTADAGAVVSVSFADQVVRTTTGTNGHWRVDLAPLEASKEGRRMTVTSAGADGVWKQAMIMNFDEQTRQGKTVKAPTVKGSRQVVSAPVSPSADACGGL